jgi:hypothetical protein
LWAIKFLEDDLYESSIHGIGDSSAVVSLSCHIVESLIGD